MHDAAIDVERLEVLHRAERLDHRAVQHARARVLAHRRGEAVDDEIDLAEVAADGGNDLVLHRIRERIAVEALRVEARRLRTRLEGTRVVPARGAEIGRAHV